MGGGSVEKESNVIRLIYTTGYERVNLLSE